jgi:hypothetical protein
MVSAGLGPVSESAYCTRGELAQRAVEASIDTQAGTGQIIVMPYHMGNQFDAHSYHLEDVDAVGAPDHATLPRTALARHPLSSLHCVSMHAQHCQPTTKSQPYSYHSACDCSPYPVAVHSSCAWLRVEKLNARMLREFEWVCSCLPAGGPWVTYAHAMPRSGMLQCFSLHTHIHMGISWGMFVASRANAQHPHNMRVEGLDF